MSDSRDLPQSAAFRNLRRMFWLRNVIAAVLALAGWVAMGVYAIPLPTAALTAALLSMLALNAFTWWRLGRPNPVNDAELLTQLLLDMAILTGLFYATGGYTNPFVWMYLLPLTVAAVALPWRHTWLVAGLAIACYSALMFRYRPLPMMPMDMSGMSMRRDSGFSVHLLGMWAGFMVSAGVIAFFVERMGRTLREYDHLIADARENALESERMLALGAMAAGAAHELGTPLSTMAVLTRELIAEHAGQQDLVSSLTLLRGQLDRCKEILSSLAASAGQARTEDGHGVALDRFLEQIIERWRDAHPAIRFDCSLHGSVPAPRIMVDRTLGQALVNLLDNSADAARDGIRVRGAWTEAELGLEIHDDGPGMTPDVSRHAGTPFFSTKQGQGMGLGLYLARVILGRFGGTVMLENHLTGGTVTSIRLPLAMLALKESA
jgi:two-component system, sensor histidine kinase RegB